MSYREFEAIVLPLTPKFSIKDIERFQKTANEKKFKFHHITEYDVLVYNSSIKILKKGDGWPYVNKIRAEKSPDWSPSVTPVDRELTEVERYQLEQDLEGCPVIYSTPMWAIVEVFDTRKVSLSK